MEDEYVFSVKDRIIVHLCWPQLIFPRSALLKNILFYFSTCPLTVKLYLELCKTDLFISIKSTGSVAVS